MDLRLDVTERDGWSVLAVHGEVDVATAPRLREQLIKLVNDERFKLVVDLGDVDFIDSTGLGVLIGARKRVHTHDGDVRLVIADRRILKVFDITGLDQIFAISASVDDALAE
jgi:anti-sigma B factor antagonist